MLHIYLYIDVLGRRIALTAGVLEDQLFDLGAVSSL